MATSPALTVMSYNILEGGQGYGSNRLELLQRAINDAAPDILVVCEANGFERGGLRALYDFEQQTGLRGVLALAETGFHVAVFARNARFIETTELSGFYHAAIRVKLEVQGHPLTVVGAHLCPFSTTIRLSEAEILANEARADAEVLLMGDLNSLSPHDPTEATLKTLDARRRQRHLKSADSGNFSVDTRVLSTLEHAGFTDAAHALNQRSDTYPTTLRAEPGKPPMRIDYVLASPPLAARLNALKTPAGNEVEHASDHRPLVARFSWGSC